MQLNMVGFFYQPFRLETHMAEMTFHINHYITITQGQLSDANKQNTLL